MSFGAGTRGSLIVSGAANVPGMSVVRGMKGVGGVCVFVWDGVGEWMRGLGLSFTNPVGTGGGCWTCVWVWFVVVWVGGLDQGLEGVGDCYVCVSCESGFFV